MPATVKKLPNILVCGTPGVGKSSLCSALTDSDDRLIHVDVGRFALDKGCLGDWDEELQTHELDEDKLIDELEPMMGPTGGIIVDHHVPDIYPERWFDIVFVLRTDNSVLHQRLTTRGYSGKKLTNNIEAEIFQTILDDARESYAPEIVHELQSNNDADKASNVKQIQTWIEMWIKDNENQPPSPLKK